MCAQISTPWPRYPSLAATAPWLGLGRGVDMLVVYVGDHWPKSAHPSGMTHTGKDGPGERPVQTLEGLSGVLAEN